MLTIYNNIQYYSKLYCYKRLSFKGMDDIFAKSRNGHLLRDTFDKESNSLDIYSNGLYPANVLSNLAHKEFQFEGVDCGSIEGFLQSLKVSDTDKQKEICALYGGSAKKTAPKASDWKKTHKLHWAGKEYDRESEEFKDLIFRAFLECYKQNDIFKTALDSTKGINLKHSSGKNDKSQTILTADEFIEILTRIREEYSN